jgi:hypothetical protein
MLYLEDWNFNDLVALCDTIDFDCWDEKKDPTGKYKKRKWAELVETNPVCSDIELCPHDQVLTFECKGYSVRGQLWEVIEEGNNFGDQMEVVEGFTKKEDGTWDLTSGVILLDDGNECSERVIVSSPIQDDDKFILYYPEDEEFDFIQGSVMFQTLDENGDLEWSCFYECDGTPWFITIPRYDHRL